MTVWVRPQLARTSYWSRRVGWGGIQNFKLENFEEASVKHFDYTAGTTLTADNIHTTGTNPWFIMVVWGLFYKINVQLSFSFIIKKISFYNSPSMTDNSDDALEISSIGLNVISSILDEVNDGWDDAWLAQE